jgi:hypothetical protein
MLNFQFGGRPSILQRDNIKKNISVSSINISLWVIELPGKKGFHSAVFERVEGTLLCLIFNWETVPQSKRQIILRRIF